MITIFNRRELMITRSMEEQAQVRNKLNEAGIDYTVKVNGGHPGATASRQDVMYEYRIFVKKVDYEQARHLI